MFPMVNTVFGNWILQIIQEHGWTQSELARRASLSPAAISDVISGRRNPGPDFCNGISEAIKLPRDEVYRIAGILPPDQQTDETLNKISHLYHTLRDDNNKQRALQFLEFLSDQEDKDDRKGKKPK